MATNSGGKARQWLGIGTVGAGSPEGLLASEERADTSLIAGSGGVFRAVAQVRSEDRYRGSVSAQRQAWRQENPRQWLRDVFAGDPTTAGQPPGLGQGTA